MPVAEYENCAVTLSIPKWNIHDLIKYDIANAHQMLQWKLLFLMEFIYYYQHKAVCTVVTNMSGYDSHVLLQPVFLQVQALPANYTFNCHLFSMLINTMYVDLFLNQYKPNCI